MGFNCFYGEVNVSSFNSLVSYSTSTDNLTVGDYYIYSPLSTESLITAICTILTSLSGSTVAYSIGSTGLITISRGAGSFSWGFSGYNILGFAASSYSGSSSYTATKSPLYCWFPERLQSRCLAPTSSRGVETPLASQSQACDGTVWTQKWGSLYKQELGYDYLTQAKTWRASTAINASVEEFYNLVLSQGKRFIFMPDQSVTSVYWKYCVDLAEMTTFNPSRKIANSDIFWSYDMSLVETI